MCSITDPSLSCSWLDLCSPSLSCESLGRAGEAWAVHCEPAAQTEADTVTGDSGEINRGNEKRPRINNQDVWCVVCGVSLSMSLFLSFHTVTRLSKPIYRYQVWNKGEQSSKPQLSSDFSAVTVLRCKAVIRDSYLDI